MKPTDVLRKQIQYYSYAISAILLLFFGKAIGNNGLAYLAMGVEVIAIFYMFIGDGVADIYSKMLRFRRQKKQFYGAFAVKKRIAVLQLILGIVFFLFVFLFAEHLSIFLFHSERGAILIRILSPLLVIRTFISIFAGYFQSFHYQVPVILVSMVRPLFFLIFANIFTDRMTDYGEKVSELLRDTDYYGMYGAVGLTCGILISELILFVIMLVFYLLNDRNYDKNKAKEGFLKSEPVAETLGNYAYQMTPGIWFGLFKRILILLPFLLLSDINVRGIYYGKFLVICSIPFFFVCARFVLIHSRITGAYRNRNNHLVNEFIQVGLQYTWAVGLLISAVLAILAPQLAGAIWEMPTNIINMLQKGSFLILPALMIVFLSIVHMAQNRRLECFITLGISAVLYIILCNVLFTKNASIEGLLTAALISLYVGMVLMTVITVFMYCKNIEYISIFILPLFCISISGLVIILISKLLSPHIGNTICFIICLVLGIVIYLGGLGIFKAFSELEMDKLYGKFGKKILSLIFR